MNEIKKTEGEGLGPPLCKGCVFSVRKDRQFSRQVREQRVQLAFDIRSGRGKRPGWGEMGGSVADQVNLL